jgi:hypothetical protein
VVPMEQSLYRRQGAVRTGDQRLIGSSRPASPGLAGLLVRYGRFCTQLADYDAAQAAFARSVPYQRGRAAGRAGSGRAAGRAAQPRARAELARRWVSGASSSGSRARMARPALVEETVRATGNSAPGRTGAGAGQPGARW